MKVTDCVFSQVSAWYVNNLSFKRATKEDQVNHNLRLTGTIFCAHRSDCVTWVAGNVLLQFWHDLGGKGEKRPGNFHYHLYVGVLIILWYQNMDILGGRQYVVSVREFGIAQQPQTLIYKCIANVFRSSNLCRALSDKVFEWKMHCSHSIWYEIWSHSCRKHILKVIIT